MLRIGGDSTDVSWVPAPGVKPPPYVTYRLTPSWLATTAALAHALGARMIMGLNLAANEPALAAAEARAFMRSARPATLAVAGDRQRAQRLRQDPVSPHACSAPSCPPAPASYDYPAFPREFSAMAARAAPAARWPGRRWPSARPRPRLLDRLDADFLRRSPACAP